jgi:3-keto-disaccharide hydrolase
MKLALSIAVASLLVPLSHAQNASVNRLSPLERDAGWHLLFDGETTQGWRSVKAEGFPSTGWDVQDGALHHTSGGGDIVTERLYSEFELEFEWKVAPGANSGVKYMVAPDDADFAYGPEYQVLDDDLHEDAELASHRAASLYDLAAQVGGTKRPVGEYNRGRIVVRDGWIEHWLNGTRVVRLQTSGEQWQVAHEQSKYAGTPLFAQTWPGRIALQDHGDEVWFRDLRIRELPAFDMSELDILPGDGLDGWIEYGDARYVREDRTILGEVDGGGQSFLLSKRSFGDFIFEVDVKTELPGNSGIQIRCHQRDDGRPFGYQIEIDPSERAWSGGLYDEARRGWLQNLEHNDAGRAAYVHGQWNRYRIECIGPWIQVRVNGVPTVDYFDLEDLEGVFGLQVHSGDNTRVRWRNPRIWPLATRRWVDSDLPSSPLVDPPEGKIEVKRVTLVGSTHESPFRLTDERDPNELFAMRMQVEVADKLQLRLSCGGWNYDLHADPQYKSGESNALGLCIDGRRGTVLLNGRPIATEIPPLEGEFALSTLTEFDKITLRHIQRLETVGR